MEGSLQGELMQTGGDQIDDAADDEQRKLET